MRGTKELREKLGREDPCVCGSTRRFRNCCMKSGCF
ncbi:MAG: SEC-C metal-binding domain-containing protein [Burkholderiaceae bacterium]